MADERSLPGRLRTWLEEQGDEHCVVVFRDADRRTRYVSDNADRLLGQRVTRIEDDIHSLVVPEDQEAVLRMSRAVRRHGVVSAFQPVGLRRADGTVTRCDLTVHNYLDDPGIGGVLIMLRPVRTETTEADLVFSLRSTSSDLIVVQDPERQTRYVSPSVRTLLGQTPDQIVAAGLDLFHPEDAPTFDAARQAVLDGAPERRLDVRARHRDGTWRTFDTVIANRLDDRTIQGIVITGRDITELTAVRSELSRARAQLEAIVRHSPDVAVVLDEGGDISYCGSSVTDVFGYAPDEVVDRRLDHFLHPDDVDLARRRLGDWLADDDDDEALALRVRHADGSYRLAEPRGLVHVDVPGLTGILVTLRDVTERVRAQRIAELTMQHSSSIALVLSVEGEIILTVGDTEPLIGRTTSIAEGMATAMFDADPPVPADQIFAEMVEGGPGTTKHVVGRLGPPGEPKRWVDIVTWNATDDPAVGGIVSSIRDIDEAVNLAEAQNRLAQVVSTTSDLVLLFDPEWNLVWCNAAGRELVGAAALDRRDVLDRTPREMRRLLEQEVRPALEVQNSWRGEVAAVGSAGEPLLLDTTYLAHRDRDGELEFISSISRDITGHRALEARLTEEARLDPLTGLPNRLALMEALEAIAHPAADVALLFVDIDHLAEVNDTRGHETGDEVLTVLAERLASIVRPQDLVARFSGDEFVVVLRGVSDQRHALVLADTLRGGLRGRVSTEDVDLFMTASVGIAMGAPSASELVAQADAAAHHAKATGRDRVAPFQRELREASDRRRQTLQDLRPALADNQLVAWFQPIVRCDDHRVVMVEALVRWHHPDRGVLSPAEFLDVAEEAGMGPAIGASVLGQTLALLTSPVARQLTSGDALVAAVNLSVDQLADAGFVDDVALALEDHDVPASQLVFEVTEGATLRDATRSKRTLHALRELGVRIALDDFGTGYSSLAYLQQLPVDILKIDRQFIADLAPTAAPSSITQAIVGLGRSLGLQIVAEGVETDAQADAIASLGCDLTQGYLYARPVPVEELLDATAALRP